MSSVSGVAVYRSAVGEIPALPGSSWEARYTVDDATLPVRVALVWSDPPGAAGATNPLVNDLDLSIRAGLGTTCAGRYVGNRLDGNEQSTWYTPCDPGLGTVEDTINNVEMARFFATAARGDTTFTVRVSSATAQQKFALVVWNAKGPPPPVPANFSATATSSSQVELTWSTSAGVTYELQRSTGAPGGYAPISCATSGCTDTAPAGTFLYRLRARSSLGASEWVFDVATTTVFTDPALSSGITVIRAAHFAELRQAVATLRAVVGLGSYSWTDASLVGAPVRAVHTTELRTALAEARNAAGLPALTFTDPSLQAGMAAKAAHVTELRQGVQ